MNSIINLISFSKERKYSRIANLNPLFPYLKSIHPTDFEQYLSRILKIRRQKTLNHTQIQGNDTNQKTTDSRLIMNRHKSLPKDQGGPVKPSPLNFTPNPLSILVVAGG